MIVVGVRTWKAVLWSGVPQIEQRREFELTTSGKGNQTNLPLKTAGRVGHPFTLCTRFSLFRSPIRHFKRELFCRSGKSSFLQGLWVRPAYGTCYKCPFCARMPELET